MIGPNNGLEGFPFMIEQSLMRIYGWERLMSGHIIFAL